MELDLADLESVRRFASAVVERVERLDLLVNNAGVMMPPQSKTADGFELQIGTNHLGHFALTGLLMDTLLATPRSRVVTVASQAHRMAELDLDDLHWERRPYKKAASYGQSKLANLLFTFELQRRLVADGADTIAVAAHPGWTGTNLQRHSGLFRAMNPIFAMKPWQGALPTLYAATGDDVNGGDYYGPDGIFEMRGYPKKVDSSELSRDEDVARRLWEISEEATGVTYPLGADRERRAIRAQS
jgi:NAD(P)-dependent dehydrogenase (short-subunit alcohol dehydrogenase family)